MLCERASGGTRGSAELNSCWLTSSSAISPDLRRCWMRRRRTCESEGGSELADGQRSLHTRLLHEQEDPVLAHVDVVLDLVQRKRREVLAEEAPLANAQRLVCSAVRACTVSLLSMMQKVSGSAEESYTVVSEASAEPPREDAARQRCRAGCAAARSRLRRSRGSAAAWKAPQGGGVNSIQSKRRASEENTVARLRAAGAGGEKGHRQTRVQW